MTNHSFYRYIIVGVLSLTIDYLLLYICFDLLGVSQNISVSIGFLLSAIFNFLLHKYYTFKSKNSNLQKEIYKYTLLITSSYFITLFLVNYLVFVGLNIYIAKTVTVILVAFYGYFIGKIVIFGGE